MQILTKQHSVKKGDYTYDLIVSGERKYLHINNHKTNDKSVIVPVKDALAVLFTNKEK